MIVGNILYAEELEYLEQRPAVVTEGDGAVMREPLLYQDMAVEASHLRDGEYAYPAEAGRGDREHLSLRDIRAEDPLAVALQTVEGDIGSVYIAFESPSREIGRTSLRLKQTVLDELIFHRAVGAHLA